MFKRLNTPSLSILSFLMLCQSLVNAQHITHKSDTACPTVHSVQEWFLQGHFHGHVRNYYMATINQGDLKNYHSNATGGAVAFQTAYLKHFALGVKGIFSYNTFGSDLNELDKTVNMAPVWERELYDINRPGIKNDLDRLEELYIKYRTKSLEIQVGKIDINKSPLLLRRDGRMNHFVYQGAWAQYFGKDYEINAGFINRVSPRGMTEWYPLNEAIGLNNNGLTYDGSPAEYHEHAQTNGLFIASFSKTIQNQYKTSLHSYSLQNIMQTTWLENEWKNDKWMIGAQIVHQTAMPKQADLAPEHRYIQPNENTWVFNGKILRHLPAIKQKISISYLRIGKNGRFLYPKELSRENFYVSQPRSWVDGYGDLNVFQIGSEYHLDEDDKLTVSFYSAYFDTPNPSNFAMNKYSVEAYWQNTLSLNYHFKDFFEGLECTFLYINRSSPFDNSLSNEAKFYRNDLHHFNFIVNLNF